MRVCGECNISIHQGLLYERRKQREGSKRRKRLEKWRWPAQWMRDGQNGGHEWSGGSRSAGRLEQHFEENESLPRETRRFERVFTNHGKVNSIYILVTKRDSIDKSYWSFSLVKFLRFDSIESSFRTSLFRKWINGGPLVREAHERRTQKRGKKIREKEKGERSWEALEASLTWHVTRKGQPWRVEIARGLGQGCILYNSPRSFQREGNREIGHRWRKQHVNTDRDDSAERTCRRSHQRDLTTLPPNFPDPETL